MFIDVDILVRREDVQEAKAVLYRLGYLQSYFDHQTFRLVPRDVQQIGEVEAVHYELAPFRKGISGDCPDEYREALASRAEAPAYVRDGHLTVVVEIDLHHNVATDTNVEQLFMRAVPSSSFNAQTLSAADHLWLNCARFYNETALFGKRSLRPLAYTAPLLRETIDWDVVIGTARDLELSASLYYPLRTLMELTGRQVPAEVLDRVNPRTRLCERDFGWQLGPLFGFVEPFPFGAADPPA